MSRVLGINRTSDASVALVDGSDAVSIAKERLSRHKHAWGALGDVADLYHPRVLADRPAPELVVECFASDPERDRLTDYRRELSDVVGPVPVIEVSHHLAHVHGAFQPSPFDEAAVLVVDNRGSPAARLDEAPPPGGWTGEGLEVISTYLARRGEAPSCLTKQLWDPGRRPIAGLGSFYSALKEAVLPGNGTEGSVMGLASLGDPDGPDLPPLTVVEGSVHVPQDWVAVLNRRAPFRFLTTGAGTFDAAADLAAAGQRAFEDALVELARFLHRRSGLDTLVYTGGCALNCAANERLARESGFSRVWIPPAPHDGGTALGCALYGAEVLGQPSRFRWRSDFLGPEHDVGPTIEDLRRDDSLDVTTPTDLAPTVAGHLVAGELVAVHRGRSESGPRALGHRSLLADARRVVVRDFVNREVKGRQWFRPLAPVVQIEHLGRWFRTDVASPFMQRAVGVTDEARRRVPAVVHHDDTARLQTVGRPDDPFLWELLEAVRAETGVGVLVNTSLNGPGAPIVETPDEAVAFFRSVPVGHLVLGSHLVSKRSPPVHPYHT